LLEPKGWFGMMVIMKFMHLFWVADNARSLSYERNIKTFS
jgi:hypothetical protein